HDNYDSVLQLDCIIIQQREIQHLEIKNFEGDFQLKDNALHIIKTDKEIKNPLNQLERGKFLLKQFLHDLGYNLPLKSYVVFVNPEFTIYQDKPKHPIVHPSQIFRFIKMLNNTPSKLTKTHYKLAHTLFS